MLALYKNTAVTGVIAIESRGFLLGSCFALERGLPLVLARKKGKLPGKTVEESYALEYGQATLQIHSADLGPGKWLIIDDLDRHRRHARSSGENGKAPGRGSGGDVRCDRAAVFEV